MLLTGVFPEAELATGSTCISPQIDAPYIHFSVSCSDLQYSLQKN